MKKLSILIIILIAITSLSCVCASDNADNNCTASEPQINQEINNNNVSNIPTNDLQLNDKNSADTTNLEYGNPLDITYKVIDITDGKAIVKFDWKLNTEIDRAWFNVGLNYHPENTHIISYDWINEIHIDPSQNSGSFVQEFDLRGNYLMTFSYHEPGSFWVHNGVNPLYLNFENYNQHQVLSAETNDTTSSNVDLNNTTSNDTNPSDIHYVEPLTYTKWMEKNIHYATYNYRSYQAYVSWCEYNGFTPIDDYGVHISNDNNNDSVI